ncbi:MAG: hypothetical protein IPM69_09830 [Ignavibacteria bacterium]|nr:hypothetical protein [Ignavibacteria bacterium]
MSKPEDMLTVKDEDSGMLLRPDIDLANKKSNDFKNIFKIGIGVTVIIIILVVAVVFYNKANYENEQNASAALSRIRVIFESGDYTKALNGDATKLIRDTPVLGLKEIVNQYGNAENGRVAALYAGNALVSIKKHSEALEYFDKSLNSSSKEVVISALIGLAVCKENQNDYKGSAEYYERASQQSTQPTTKDKLRLYAAMSFEKAGIKEKAEVLFRDILSGESSEFISESKSGLTRLGMIVE